MMLFCFNKVHILIKRLFQHRADVNNNIYIYSLHAYFTFFFSFTSTASLFLHVSAFPGPPAPPKVVSAYDDCVNISWDSPSNRGGSRILGYILEKRKKGSNLWTVVNAMDELIKGLHFYLTLVQSKDIRDLALMFCCL